MKRIFLFFVAAALLGCSTPDSGTDFDSLEISSTQCQDGLDNDDDGQSDCDDADCAGFIFCALTQEDTGSDPQDMAYRGGIFVAVEVRLQFVPFQVVEAAQPFKEVSCVFETVRALDDTRNLRKTMEEWDDDFE